MREDLIDGTESALGTAPLIALVGSDGSGKSTVGEALLTWLRETRPAELCHLGKQTGNIARAVARWPLVGGGVGKAIEGGVKRAGDPRGPRLLAALAIYLLSMRRVRRFRRMLAVRRSGVTVLTDRFPQVEVPGPMDGLGLDGPPPRGRLARMLAARERRLYDWMVGHKPDLVIRLVVDFETAFARKPDHRPSSLERKIADLARIGYGGAPIVDIDATRPLDEVVARAKAAVSALLDAQADATLARADQAVGLSH